MTAKLKDGIIFGFGDERRKELQQALFDYPKIEELVRDGFINLEDDGDFLFDLLFFDNNLLVGYHNEFRASSSREYYLRCLEAPIEIGRNASEKLNKMLYEFLKSRGDDWYRLNWLLRVIRRFNQEVKQKILREFVSQE